MLISGNQTKQQATMTVVNVCCGCGFIPKTLEQAKKHAEESGHVLTLSGQIGPTEKLKGVRLW